MLSGVLGLLGVIAGLVVMRRPGESLLAIILILGVWFVVSGLVDAIRALVVPGDRAFRLLVALFDLVLGGLILALPDVSLKTMAVLAGIAFIVRGIFAVVIGLKLREVQRSHPARVRRRHPGLPDHKRESQPGGGTGMATSSPSRTPTSNTAEEVMGTLGRLQIERSIELEDAVVVTRDRTARSSSTSPAARPAPARPAERCGAG